MGLPIQSVAADLLSAVHVADYSGICAVASILSEELVVILSRTLERTYSVRYTGTMLSLISLLFRLPTSHRNKGRHCLLAPHSAFSSVEIKIRP